MKLKLDLHTHVWEAFNFQPPSLALAERLIGQIKERGIDGVGITDHHNWEWGAELRKIIEDHHPGEVVIIPGWEIERRPPVNPFDEYQVTELLLPEGGVYRIYCHPGYYSPNIIVEENVHGIEIENHLHNWHIRKPQVQEVAEQHGLRLFQVSDAHVLENVGIRYTEVELDDLYRVAMPLDQWKPTWP